MDVRVVPIQQLSDVQMAELVKLHQNVLHSLLSDLGLGFLEKYYRVARREKSVTGFCVLSEADLPIGWVLGSPKPEQLNRQLRQPLTWFLPQMLRVAITRPLLLWQLALSASSSSTRLEPEQIELTYIGVDPSARRMGLGRKLIEEFVQASRDKHRSVILSVEVENTSAIQLYTTFGFQVIETLTEGRFQRHRMRLQLHRLPPGEAVSLNES